MRKRDKTELWTLKETLVWRRDDRRMGEDFHIQLPNSRCGHRTDALRWPGLEMEAGVIHAEVSTPWERLAYMGKRRWGEKGQKRICS